jgi:amino acid adenylation domain-containing protein
MSQGNPPENHVYQLEEIVQTIPMLFTVQVKLYPTRTAISTEIGRITYGQLDRATNCLACAIQARLGRDAEPVAMLVSQAVVGTAMIAILKSGKFYVPLDPRDPLERIQAVLDDSGAALILTDACHARLAARLVSIDTSVLNMDALDLEAVMVPSVFDGTAAALACILYTSGSSGTPKGVLFNHRSILHMVAGNTCSLRITAFDRVALLSACTFIGSTAAVFRALLNGATLCPFDLRSRSFNDLAHWLRQEQITLAQFVPTVFRYLAAALESGPGIPSLRCVHLAGEGVDSHDVELFDTYFAQSKLLINEMGATETGACRRFIIRHGTYRYGIVVPVGYEVEDKEVLLLDEQGNRVVGNETGEIAVKSCYLAQGYWRQPVLTAARFLPTPGDPDARIFLTGDLGRMDSDQCLHYLDRKDRQVKIRGHRVDLAEIEHIMRAVVKGRAVAVVAQFSDMPDGRLVAYIAAHGDTRLPGIQQIRRELVRTLPEVMIPSLFVFLDVLPLTASGKIDRQSLPIPDCNRPLLEEASYVAPETAVERVLEEIWTSLLNYSRIGINDDFLLLGGDSLFIVQVINRIRTRYAVDIPVELFFEYPTIAMLASLIEKRLSP